MSRKSKDFELVTIKKKRNDKLEFEISHNPGTQNTRHYQCLSATNREEPEHFMNSTRKQEAEPGGLKPEVYVNIAHATLTSSSQTLTSSSKKDGRGSRKKCLLVVCCVLVVFLVFALSLTFVGLNRSELMKNEAEDSHSTATSNMLIMNLTKQVRDLEESLSQSKAVIQNLSTRLAAHVSDYRDLVSTSENNERHY